VSNGGNGGRTTITGGGGALTDVKNGQAVA
jgi:hypothetical protein